MATTLHGAYEEQSTATPSALASICCGHRVQSLTYAAVCNRSRILAAGLSRIICTLLEGERCRCVAVHASRTHPDFLPLLLALSRLACPFVLLSTDLPDHALQNSRNAYILQTLLPQVCITTSCGILPVADGTHELPLAEIELASVVEELPQAFSKILCFLFTGGTQRTKIVMSTHAMVLHERSAYRELWRPRTFPPVVLAHTSVYWAASALGQMSIALAYGGAAVWTEATEVAQLQRCIAEQRVTVLGVVPDHLDLLAPESPGRELPHVEIVFTWGERLPKRIANRWREHPRAILRELLIATEYWLSFWADPLGDDVLQKVRGVHTLVLKDCGGPANVGEVGELCISGPMVMAGYYGGSGSAASEPDRFHIDSEGRQFFRTSDLVRRVSQGFVYKGRADMMAKDKGKWVDMLAIEDQILQLRSIQAAKILPDPSHENFHAFIVLEPRCSPNAVLDAIRVLLPPRVQLWVVGRQLPRHPVTRKVDAARLLELVGGSSSSWPLEGDADLRNAPADLRERLLVKMYNHALWVLVAFTVAVAVAEPDSLQWQFSLLLAWGSTVAWLQVRYDEDADKALLAVTSLWCAGAVLGGSWTIGRLFQCTLSLVLLSYGWHALIFLDASRDKLWLIKIVMLLLDNLPMHKLGAFAFFSFAQHHQGSFGAFCRVLLLIVAFVGAFMALVKRRFFAWPVMLWTLGAGNQLKIECEMWLTQRFWWWQACRIYDLFEFFLGVLSCRSCRVKVQTPEPTQAASEECLTATPDAACDTCSRCELRILEWQRKTRDDHGFVLCEECGVASVVELERAAMTWLLKVVSLDVARTENAEPSAKRQRTKDGGADAPHATGCNRDDAGQGDFDIDMEPVGASAKNFSCLRWDREQNEEFDIDFDYQKRIERWWWYDHVSSIWDLTEEQERRAAYHLGAEPLSSRQAANAAPTHSVPAEMSLLTAVIAQIEPLLKPVHMQTVLVGLDSLRVIRLANAIKTQLGRSLSVEQIRAATTVADLALAVSNAEETPLEGATCGKADDGHGKEYIVWFSPGQYGPMGNWVLRIDEALDYPALCRATQQLVDRHAVLRAEVTDNMRYMSVVYDSANLFLLYMPVLAKLLPSMVMWVLQRMIPWALAKTWPRLQCKTREEIYRDRYPDTKAPLTIEQVSDGQEAFEKLLKWKRNVMHPPGEFAGYELNCYLVDVWAWYRGWQGRFVIMRTPSSLTDAIGSKLVYVDFFSKDWGPLISPGSPSWQTPPYGFPALFCIPFRSGALAWLRLDTADELRFCYRGQAERSSRSYHLTAYRAAPQRGHDAHQPVKVSYLSISLFHSLSDGNCYLPLVQDFFGFYDAARHGEKHCSLPAAGVPLRELERRLMDTFYSRPSPMRSSLRGSIWKFRGRGYTHDIGLNPGATRAISYAAARYRVPFDVALLGLVVCAQARADEVDKLEFTLYTPMRDGAAEAMAIGLFSDWRDLCVDIDRELATHLGTVLQISHKIQHRQWSVFNALRKPERTLVNIQPLDFEKRAGFVHLGENLWHGGDQLGRIKHREGKMDWVRQPLTWVIEQQDEEIWWILAAVCYDSRNSQWMRRFLFAFHEAFWAFLLDPLVLVHRPLPNDESLVMAYVDEGSLSGTWGPEITKTARKATSPETGAPHIQ